MCLQWRGQGVPATQKFEEYALLFEEAYAAQCHSLLSEDDQTLPYLAEKCG
jgi:hypothetical protein